MGLPKEGQAGGRDKIKERVEGPKSEPVAKGAGRAGGPTDGPKAKANCGEWLVRRAV